MAKRGSNSYDVYRSKGVCGTCGKPPLPGFVHCAEHREHGRRYLKRRYDERKAAGLCVYCAKPQDRGSMRCNACYERNKTYLAKAPKADRTDYNKARTLAQKIRVFKAYGGVRCACCGETEIKFLTLDHINNDGNAHRRALKSEGVTRIYRWLETNHFPPGFQVLCFNCNCGKNINGGVCPHSVKEEFVPLVTNAVWAAGFSPIAAPQL